MTQKKETNEIDSILAGTFLSDGAIKKAGICRSSFQGTAGDSYKWFAYEAKGGYAMYLALHNFQSKTMIKDAVAKPWQKTCPKCQAFMHVRKKLCDCGYAFPGMGAQ